MSTETTPAAAEAAPPTPAPKSAAAQADERLDTVIRTLISSGNLHASGEHALRKLLLEPSEAEAALMKKLGAQFDDGDAPAEAE